MDLTPIPTDPGVYCMFDLDDTPTYAGQTSNLRSRLRQHFVRQDSSVSSYGRLDPWDIASVEWWTTEQTDNAEQDLLGEFQPYLNFAAESDAQPLQGGVACSTIDKQIGTLFPSASSSFALTGTSFGRH